MERPSDLVSFAAVVAADADAFVLHSQREQIA